VERKGSRKEKKKNMNRQQLEFGKSRSKYSSGIFSNQSREKKKERKNIVVSVVATLGLDNDLLAHCVIFPCDDKECMYLFPLNQQHDFPCSRLRLIV
jgi:hypothetical protein